MQPINQTNPTLESLMQRDSVFAPPAPYAPSVGPERRYCEVRSEFQRDMAALYPNRVSYRYHNLEDHIVPGVRFLKTLVDRCNAEGVPLDIDVADAAWRGHDVGYAFDPGIFGFKSREHMHATIAYRSLRSRGMGEEFSRRVERAIACTNVFETPRTNEDKAIRATDMHNLAQDYHQMRDNTLRLYEEMRNTADATLSVPDFVRGSVKYLGLYMLPSLKLTTAAIDSEGRSDWHVKAFGNVVRLWREHCCVDPQILAVMGGVATPPELIERRGLTGGHEAVIFGASEESAKDFHTVGTRLLRRWGCDAALACTPMVAGAISLPAHIVDEVLLGGADFERYLSEAIRIMRPGGQLTISCDFSSLSLQRSMEIAPILVECGFELVSEESDVHGSVVRFKQVVIQ